MQWLVQIFNKIYLNLAKFFGGLGVFVFAVMFVMLSAQYLGDRISGRIISNRSVVFTFVFSKEDFDDKSYYNFAKQMLKNETLKRNNVKVRIKKYSNDKKIVESSFDVIITNNKALMEKLSLNKKFRVLNNSLFSVYSKPHLLYSELDDYVKVSTNYDVDVYMGMSGDLPSIQEAKVYSAIERFGSFAVRKTLPDSIYK